MPVWGIWLDGLLLFDTHPRSRKARNLTHDQGAVVHLESSEEVVILEGTVEVDEDVDPERFARFVQAYGVKYDLQAQGAFEFTPHLAYAWRNDDFAGSATRFAFDAAIGSS